MTRRPFVCLPVSGQPVTTGTHRFADTSAISTALRESAYLRRTRYIQDDGSPWFDFTTRGADLVAISMIRPPLAPAWTTSPFRVWAMSDYAARTAAASDKVRAWQIVADLPATRSHGEWLDDAVALVTAAFKGTDAIVEIGLHAPAGGVPHAHILVTARHLERARFGASDPARADIISGQLKKSWLRWLRRYRPVKTAS